MNELPGNEEFTTLDLILSTANCNFQGRNRLYELIASLFGSLGPLRPQLEIRGTARRI